jgi:glycosyltransferase involved in cell wall biosynthesis
MINLNRCPYGAKMKILQVNARLFSGGGDAKYMFNLARVLETNGHAIAFFAMENKRNNPDPNSDLFPSKINYRELNKEKSIADGFRVLSRAIYSREAQVKFRNLLHRIQPDVVHLHNIHAHLTPSIIFEASKQNIPVLWTLHDYKLICPNSHFLIDQSGELCEACGRSSYYMPLVKRCKKGSLLASVMASIEAYIHMGLRIREKVDAFICPSQFLRDKFLDRGFNPEKLYHLPNVLLDKEFKASSADDGYLLFLGKLEPIKGIRVLVEASRKAHQVDVVLAGTLDDSFREELYQLLPPNARYVGVLNGEELHQYLRKARAVILPSIWYENQPYTILEAFANAKPVIASDLGGMTELVTENERGLLVPPGDSEALANAMQYMASNPTEAKNMGENAYRYAKNNHPPGNHYTEIMNIYHEVLSRASFDI